MNRESVLIILGILIAFSPYSGLPLSILAFVLPVLGLLVAAIGMTMRIRRKRALQETNLVVPVYEAPQE